MLSLQCSEADMQRDWGAGVLGGQQSKGLLTLVTAIFLLFIHGALLTWKMRTSLAREMAQWVKCALQVRPEFRSSQHEQYINWSMYVTVCIPGTDGQRQGNSRLANMVTIKFNRDLVLKKKKVKKRLKRDLWLPQMPTHPHIHSLPPYCE